MSEPKDKAVKWQHEFERLIADLPPSKQQAFKHCMTEMRKAVVRNVKAEAFIDELGNLPAKGNFAMGHE